MIAKAITQPEKSVTPVGMLHLTVVYLVWGSTYLAIRVAVRPGAGFPPFTMAMMRVFSAGAILLLLAWLSRRALRLSRREFGLLAASGILLWTGGNGFVTWAEQHADSGLAALIIGTTPIWTAIMESILDRRLPSGHLVISLVVGFLGIGLLTAPILQSGVRADVVSVFVLIAATITWGMGALLQSRRPVSVPPMVSSGVQMLAGGVGFAVLVLLFDEPAPAPIPEAWLAWGYLVLIGAVVAFTSFVTALRIMPANVVMTYAYVNPVIAVILGFLILGEPITLWTIGGALLVLAGVYGVFRERYGSTRKRLTPENAPTAVENP